jgi:opacity protein-like surface antigen
MRRLALATLAVLFLSAPAQADFIKNAADWRRLGPEGQAAYAMAIYDVMSVVTADNKYTAARAMGLRACGVGLQLKGAMVAQAINIFYRDHPEARVATPFVAFNGYFERGVCSPFINKAREEMGLPPMKTAPLPEAKQQPEAPQPEAQQ